jgi:hypothetical protein
MSILAYVLLSISTLLLCALLAYLWYVTPSPQDLAEEGLSPRKRRISAAAFRATKPQRNMTHINCLS